METVPTLATKMTTFLHEEQLYDSTNTLYDEMEAHTLTQKIKAKGPDYESVREKEQEFVKEVHRAIDRREIEKELERDKLPNRFFLWSESAALVCEMGEAIAKESRMYTLKSDVAQILGFRRSAGYITRVTDIVKQYTSYPSRRSTSTHETLKLTHNLSIFLDVVADGTAWCKRRVEDERPSVRRRNVEVCEIKKLMFGNAEKRVEIARILKNVAFLEEMVGDGDVLVKKRGLAVMRLEEALMEFGEVCERLRRGGTEIVREEDLLGVVRKRGKTVQVKEIEVEVKEVKRKVEVVEKEVEDIVEEIVEENGEPESWVENYTVLVVGLVCLNLFGLYLVWKTSSV